MLEVVNVIKGSRCCVDQDRGIQLVYQGSGENN